MSKAAVALLKYTKVNIPKIIFDRSDWVKYLVVFDWQKKLIDEDVFAAVTGERFNQFVREQINSYMVEKKAPPKEIAGAIYNIVDDMLSGREPTLRAGDYIVLQNFMRRAPAPQ